MSNQEIITKLLAVNFECNQDFLDIADTSEIKGAIMSIKEISTAQQVAIKFNGVREFLSYEDVLCDLMGEDEYFDWAESAGVQ